MESKQDKAASREQQAREQGKAIPFYARKVTRELAQKKKPRKFTPPKRAD